MKNPTLYTPVFAFTLLLSAALLFSVQPMFSKMILPMLGGTPQVWNTAMLFFQVMLLAGYAYAHATSRFLPIRTQAILHAMMLFIFIIALPFGIPDGWVPPTDSDPTIWQLSLMTIVVGGPFFVLAASAPMFQRWFSGTNHPDADNPYFLYGASNLGSMVSLLAYPVLIEPFLTLPGQSEVWMFGYFGLIACVLACVWLLYSTTLKTPKKTKSKAKAISWETRLYWILMSFIPSSLMLGVTTYITSDIATVPLFWILPLALYVGTFIIVFSRKELISKNMIMLAQGVLITLVLMKMAGQIPLHPIYLVILHLCLFFTCALACHRELADSRPDSSNLTEFYLLMSLGGALGGFFNAIIAPVFFILPIEYALVLCGAIVMRFSMDNSQSLTLFIKNTKATINKRGLDSLFSVPAIAGFVIVFASLAAFTMQNSMASKACAIPLGLALLCFVNKRWSFAIASLFVLFHFPPGYVRGDLLITDTLYRGRNFFGIVRVEDTVEGERMLLHGTTNHGTQVHDKKYNLVPMSYYSKVSPIRHVFEWLDRDGGRQKVGVVGLGVGVTACFKKPGRHYDYYEINPEVVHIAENKEFFTYLSDCGSDYSIILGDGRLTLENAKDESYDMLFLDAFTSDNIPAHLLTKEAITLYMKKLKKNGVLLVHISNRYLNIEPVLAQAGKELGIPTFGVVSMGGEIPGTKLTYYPTHFVTLSNNPAYNNFIQRKGWTPAILDSSIKAWTDNFSNIVMTLGNRAGDERARILVKDKKAKEEKK